MSDYSSLLSCLELPAISRYLIATLAPLVIWRIYRFSISPLLHPNEPKEYPYWMPLVGHLWSFFKNSSQLLTDARLYFRDTREAFALNVAGQTWYILTDSEDVSATYKINDGSLSYDIFAKEVMRVIGITSDGIEKAFRRTDGAKSQKHLVGLCKEYQLLQLSPGERFDELLRPTIMSIRKDIQRLTKQQKERASITEDKPGTIISLYQFISEVFISFGQKAYFGETLVNIDPEMASAFMEFDTVAWQVLYQYPSILCGKMLRAKKRIQAALEGYLDTPCKARSDAAWMISELEKDMRRLEVSKHDMALFFFQLYWSVNGNIKKAPFWMLSYMLFQPELIPRVREEIKPAFAAGHISIEYLSENCPLLLSIWEETVRLTSFAASVRFLTRDVNLGDKILRKGNRIMIPQRQIHYNTSVFCSNAAQFDPERFLKNPKLKRHSSFRPFGGGTTLCPGRYLAKMTTLAFVAELIYAFDLELVGDNPQLPRATDGNPSIGLVDVVPGTDLKVKLRLRSHH